MGDIALDLDILSTNLNDLQIVNNDLVLTSGINEVLQNVLQSIRTYYGEWFMDITIGIPYFQQVLVKNPDKAQIDALFQSAILSSPGITQLNTYSSNIDTLNRQIFIRFNASTATGVVEYSGYI